MSRELFDAVVAWQSDSKVHPLTCRQGGAEHQPLIPKIDGNRTVLMCLDCGAQQTHIPSLVLEAFRSKGPG